MSIDRFKTLGALGALLAAFASTPAQAQADAQVQADDAVRVDEYAVFVDLPTAFAFIKLPMGWKFIGKLDADQLRHLPADTLTSLLPAADAADAAERLASAAQKPPARKPKG